MESNPEITGPTNAKKSHSVKVPRLYKDAAKALMQVEENGEGLKNAIHSLKHPNVKALTALVSEALKHAPQLETILTKSKFFKKETGLSKQTHLTKILITELLWGKKRLGGESRPILTVVSYKDKFEYILGKLEPTSNSDSGSGSTEYKYMMSYQITILTEFFVVSMCMFTLPFLSYFGTQHVLKAYYPSMAESGWDFFLPVVTSVVTVWVIISLYIIRAFRDPNNFKVTKKDD